MVGGTLRKALFGSPNFLIGSEMICYIFCGSLYKFANNVKTSYGEAGKKKDRI